MPGVEMAELFARVRVMFFLMRNHQTVFNVAVAFCTGPRHMCAIRLSLVSLHM